jgi:acyl-CoA hydrolase
MTADDQPIPLEERLKRSEARSLEHIFPSNTNPLGNAFGGHVVSLMDKIAGYSASRFSRGIVVTASIDKLSFNVPILMGDYVELVARVESVGRTSMRIRVEVFRMTPNEAILATAGNFVFVALDADGKPRPVL